MSIREEIHKIKQNAINAAKEEAQQAIKAKKEELERKMANFYTELVSQKKNFKIICQHTCLTLNKLCKIILNSTN